MFSSVSVQRGPRAGIRLSLCSDKSPCPGTIPAVSVLPQDRTQPPGNGTRVLPAPKKGFGMDPGDVLQVTHPRRGITAGQPYLGARSTTRTGGTWQGLGDKSTISDRALAEPPPSFSCKIGRNSLGQRLPVLPIPSPAHRTCLVLSRGLELPRTAANSSYLWTSFSWKSRWTLSSPFSLLGGKKDFFSSLCFSAKTSLKSTIKQTKTSS